MDRYLVFYPRPIWGLVFLKKIFFSTFFAPRCCREFRKDMLMQIIVFSFTIHYSNAKDEHAIHAAGKYTHHLFHLTPSSHCTPGFFLSRINSPSSHSHSQPKTNSTKALKESPPLSTSLANNEAPPPIHLPKPRQHIITRCIC